MSRRDIGMHQRDNSGVAVPERAWRPAVVRRGVCLVDAVRVRIGPTPRPVAEGNCVFVRGGGEQPEANRRSVG